jgi:hypothetical protein
MRRIFHNLVAMQHIFRLCVTEMTLDSGLWLAKRRLCMGLTRSINAVMICAAFAFIGALIVGVLP